ncbi:extracellular solute-binding protein [Nonomuraea ferruginea]
MGVSFMKGEHPMMVSGSWWYGRFASEIKDFEWGHFLWPGATMAPGSSGNLWVVPEKSENKDLAYDFIDITMSKDVQNLLGNSGGVPVAADPAAITDAKSKELIESFNTLTARDGLAFYPDWLGARLLRRHGRRHAEPHQRQQAARRDAGRARAAVRGQPRRPRQLDARP